MLTSGELLERAWEACKLSEKCRLCPRRCGVDRPSGAKGFCGAGPIPTVASVLPHFGEEPPLVGAGGAGTIFFSHCNLACVYCQNHQISHGGAGDDIDPDILALRILDLQKQGCVNLEAVSPSHHLPGFLFALAEARGLGLTLPVVYNTNGYESAEVLDLLDGVVDIYLPDLKYSSDEIAHRLSGVDDYVEIARAAVLKMASQVGDLVVDNDGLAMRGMILRHLVLPGELAGSFETLLWISANLPATTSLSIMAQYSPLHKAARFPPLHERLTAEEYEDIVDTAGSLGFKNVFVQELASQDTGIPDFSCEAPFDWTDTDGAPSSG